MVSIDISDLEAEEKNGIVSFMESKLPLKSEKDGDIVTFEDKSSRSHVTSPEVRTYLKRYLHSKDLRKQYRVLSESGSLKFVKQKIQDEEEDEKQKRKGGEK
ncbi:MAG: hypothetical protein ACREBS_02845 [Nitrososphaerales archaeon]